MPARPPCPPARHAPRLAMPARPAPPDDWEVFGDEPTPGIQRQNAAALDDVDDGDWAPDHTKGDVPKRKAKPAEFRAGRRTSKPRARSRSLEPPAEPPAEPTQDQRRKESDQTWVESFEKLRCTVIRARMPYSYFDRSKKGGAGRRCPTDRRRSGSASSRSTLA